MRELKSVPAEAKSALGRSAQRHFRGHLAFALMSGSALYGGAQEKSDLDVLVVLKQLPEIRELIEQTRGFVADYVRVHQEHGFKPDCGFPGEFVTIQNLDEAMAGRGFLIGSDGQLAIPIPSCDADYVGNRDLIYPVWMTMTAFSEFLTGEREAYDDYRSKSWETILKFLIQKAGPTTINANSVLQVLLGTQDQPGDFKVGPSYPDFVAKEKASVAAALQRLRIQSLLGGDEHQYTVLRHSLAEWEASMVQAIRNAAWRAAYPFSVEEERSLSAHATSLAKSDL